MKPQLAAERKRILALMAKPQKRSKYRAVRCEVDGDKFDSQKEALRWSDLQTLQRIGVIRNLQRQYPVKLHVPVLGYPGIHREIGRLTFDFVYVEVKTGERVYEDVKSPATRKNTAYRLRKRMFETEYSVKILET